jgi:hypothetical protein
MLEFTRRICDVVSTGSWLHTQFSQTRPIVIFHTSILISSALTGFQQGCAHSGHAGSHCARFGHWHSGIFAHAKTKQKHRLFQLFTVSKEITITILVCLSCSNISIFHFTTPLATPLSHLSCSIPIIHTPINIACDFYLITHSTPAAALRRRTAGAISRLGLADGRRCDATAIGRRCVASYKICLSVSPRNVHSA